MHNVTSLPTTGTAESVDREYCAKCDTGVNWGGRARDQCRVAAMGPAGVSCSGGNPRNGSEESMSLARRWIVSGIVVSALGLLGSVALTGTASADLPPQCPSGYVMVPGTTW